MLKRLEQVCIENTYSKDQIKHVIIMNMEKYPLFKEAVDKGVHFISHYINIRNTYHNSKTIRVTDLLYKYIDKLDELVADIFISIMESGNTQTIQSVVGKLAKKIKYEDPFDGIKTMAELIAVLEPCSIYEIIPSKDSPTGGILVKSNYQFDNDVKQFIQNTCYLPPLICEPLEIHRNTDSAYLAKERDHLLLGKQTKHNKCLSTDVINKLNAVPLTIDEYVINNFVEKSKKPLDSIEKKNNFNRMVLGTKHIVSLLLNNDNEFWFSWKYDFRGRMYSQGYQVNIQGNSYKKAMLNLAVQERIKETL